MSATTARKTRKPAAKPIAAQGPNIAEETLKDIEQVAHAKPLQRAEGKLAISNDTFVQAINTAGMSYKFAFYMEMSVCLAMFAEAGDTGKDTKRALYEIYQQCGYDCKNITGSDYKTISRRTNAAASLFDWLGKEKVQSWISGAAEMMAINAIVKQLEAHNLRGINSVLALTGKPVQKALPKAPEAQQPAQAPSQQPQSTPANMADKVAKFVGNEIEKARDARNRRQNDVPGALTFSAEGVQVIVSPNASKSALMQVALELLEFANTLNVAEESVAA